MLAGTFLLAGCDSPKASGEQAAGPFTVSLTTSPSPPEAGLVAMTVDVAKNGTPVADAKVVLETSMPGMNMPGPTIDLEVSGGHYIGNVNMMAGEWRIKVMVIAGGENGEASYDFAVK